MTGIEDKDIWLLTIVKIDGLYQDSEEVTITFSNGWRIVQNHIQDCCESVRVEQVDGEPSRLIGTVIYGIDEKITEDVTPADESATATFYTLRTSAGYLDWRWLGESNGYYSERVDCELLKAINA
jgi:hypothetical protein